MATRRVHLVVDAADPPGLARFWSAALRWEIGAEEPGEVVVWPRGYGYPDPAALPLVFVPVPEPKAGKNRVHIDLASESVAHQAAEPGRCGRDQRRHEAGWNAAHHHLAIGERRLERRRILHGGKPLLGLCTEALQRIAQIR